MRLIIGLFFNFLRVLKSHRKILICFYFLVLNKNLERRQEQVGLSILHENNMFS